ncbi:MAG TPA: hypothetical protein VGV64_05335 [Thermoplasmata archaeon]|nr:hypothetical protein [Thermoplasmata archaeon]
MAETVGFDATPSKEMDGMIGREPEAMGGTVIEQEKDPRCPTTPGHEVEGDPPNERVMVAPMGNPDPRTSAEAPTGPDAGLTESVGPTTN